MVGTSSSCHPSPIYSTNSNNFDDWVNGSYRSSVIRDLDQSYTTILEMHGQEEQLWSSLEVAKVALVLAHGDRVVAQA